MKKTFLLSTCLCFSVMSQLSHHAAVQQESEPGVSNMNTYEVPQDSLYVPIGLLGQVRVMRDENNQFVSIINDSEPVSIRFVKGLPNGISNEQLKLANLYFRLKQVGENGILEVNGRLQGGILPIPVIAAYALIGLGCLVYWGIIEIPLNGAGRGQSMAEMEFENRNRLDAARRAVQQQKDDEEYARKNPTSYTAYELYARHSQRPYEVWSRDGSHLYDVPK